MVSGSDGDHEQKNKVGKENGEWKVTETAVRGNKVKETLFWTVSFEEGPGHSRGK